MSHVTDSPGRLLLAVLSVAVAVFGVVLSILSAGSIVAKSFVTIEDLAKEERSLQESGETTPNPNGQSAKGRLLPPWGDRASPIRTGPRVTDPLLLGGFSDVDVLWKSYGRALRRNRDAVCSLYRHQGRDLPPGKNDEEAKYLVNEYDARTGRLQRKALAAANLVRFHDQVCLPLLARQSFLQVRAGYERHERRGGMRRAECPRLCHCDHTTHIITSCRIDPVQVRVLLREMDHARFASVLGTKRDLTKEMSGTAIATEGNVSAVAVPATRDCSEAILRLAPQDAHISRVSNK